MFLQSAVAHCIIHSDWAIILRVGSTHIQIMANYQVANCHHTRFLIAGILLGLCIGTIAASYYAISAVSSAKSKCEQDNRQFIERLSKLVEKVRGWTREGRRDKLDSFLKILNDLRAIYFGARDYLDAFEGLTQPPPVNATRQDLLSYADFESRNINTVFGQAFAFNDLVYDMLWRSRDLMSDP